MAGLPLLLGLASRSVRLFVVLAIFSSAVTLVGRFAWSLGVKGQHAERDLLDREIRSFLELESSESPGPQELDAVLDELSPTLAPMADGRPCIRLTQKVEWHHFADVATAVVNRLGGTIDVSGDSPDDRVWSATIDGEPFWIAYDAWSGITLEPDSSGAATRIPGLKRRLTQGESSPAR